MVNNFTSSVSGSYERGLEFGSVHAEKVAANVAAYQQLFALRGAEAGISAASVRAIVSEVGLASLSQVDAWAPALGREIRGIADGAGAPLKLIAALNARTEVLAVVCRGNGARGECSTVVTLGIDGHEPVAMQNWDWYMSWAGNWLTWTIPHQDGSVTTTTTEYGIVGKIGLGRHGLGVLFNKLGHERDGRGPAGVPLHVISRQLMDTSASVAEAVSLAHTVRVSASSSLTLVTGSAAGKAAVCAEFWPGGVGLIERHDGLLCHTNHFLHKPASDGDTGVVNGPDTLTRLDALHRQLDPSGVAATTAEVTRALCDHGEGPNSLCCHPDPADPEWARYSTLLTASLDFSSNTLAVHPGRPCSHDR